MRNTELDHVSTLLDKASRPEDVFGPASGSQAEMLATIKGAFRQIAKVVHPDAYQQKDLFLKASAAFKKLMLLWEQAQTKIANGTYALTDKTDNFNTFVIRNQASEYRLESLLAQGDLCGLYLASTLRAGKQVEAIMKMSLQPTDNDLSANEARILTHLQKSDDYDKQRHFVSQLIEAFSYREKTSGIARHINVLAYTPGLYSLKEVRDAYTQGLDPKDMAWIWRRLLIALGFSHSNGVIHGAVLPTHILIHPEQHGVILIDWSYATLHSQVTGERIRAISSPYREWYPVEVMTKEVPTPGLDLAMAARCMLDLLGGDPYKQVLPA